MAVGVINDPFTLELKIRFMLQDNSLLFKDSKAHGAPMVPQCNRSPGDITRPSNDAEADGRKLLDEINGIYIEALKAMPKSCMLHLFSASFHLNSLSNRAQCLAMTAKASLMNPNLDEAFMIFKRQRLLNDKFGGGDVIDFIAYEQNLKLAKLNERRATIAGVQFWSELIKRHPSFHKLQSHGSAISTAISLAQEHFQTLLKLSPESPGVYRMYGRFLINALNDKRGGQDLLDHADEIDEDADRENSEEEDEDEDSGSGGWSGSNLGSGMSLDESEPLQRQVSINMFSEDNCVIDRSRQVLGLHKDGHLIPIVLCVKHAVDADGKQSFIGIIKLAKESPHIGFIMFYAEDMKVKYGTKNLEERFEFRSKNSDLMIGDIFPGLDPTTIDAVSNGGFQSEVTKDMTVTTIKVAGEKIFVQGIHLIIARVVFRNREIRQSMLSPSGNLQAGILAPPNQRILELGEACDEMGSMPMVFSQHNSKADLTQSHRNSMASASGTPMEISTQQFGPSSSMSPSALSGTNRLAMKNMVALDSMKSEKSVPKAESSYSKSSSSRNVKRIISERNSSSNKHLTYIHLAYIFCLLLLSTDAIYQDITFVQIYTEICNEISNMNARLQSALFVAQISDSVRSLDLHRIHWVESNNMTCAEGIADAQRHILNNTEYITSTLDQFLNIPGNATILNEDSAVLYTMNTFEGITKFINAAESVASSQMADPEMAANIAFILNNGPVSATLAPVLSVCMVFFIIFPVYYFIEKYRNRFLKMFCDIPKDVVKGIHDAHLKRLIDAQDEEDGDDDGNTSNTYKHNLAIENLILSSELDRSVESLAGLSHYETGQFAGLEWLEDTVFYISEIQSGFIPFNLLAGAAGADAVVTNLRSLNTNYLTPNIATSAQMFWLSWQNAAASFSIFQIAFTCCYILALLLLYLFVFRPMLHNMGQEMKRTSALVHMIPSEIIHTVPSFKAWAAEMGMKNNRNRQGSTASQTKRATIDAPVFETAIFAETLDKAKATGGKQRELHFQDREIIKSADLV
ncbi:hypothetical protein HDU98_008888 [Podochytrium sp. JEL0797]|nr:hypothetical protein HDU98_008888 [Podochytrium sp. JEL0797]